MQAIIYLFRCPKGRVYAGWRGVSPEALRTWPRRGVGPLPCGYIGSGVAWLPVARRHRKALRWVILARVDGDRADVDVAEVRAIHLTRLIFGPRCKNIRDGGQGSTSEEARALWADPDYVERTTKANREARKRPDVRAKRRAVSTALWSDPSYADKTVAAIREGCARPEVRAKNSTSTAARWTDPDYAARTTAAIKEALNRPEVKAKIGAISTALWADPGYAERTTAALQEANARPEVRAKNSAAHKALAQTPERRAHLDLIRADAAAAGTTPEAIAKRQRTRALNDGWRLLAEQHPEWWVP